MSIALMIIGIISVVIYFIPLCNYFALVRWYWVHSRCCRYLNLKQEGKGQGIVGITLIISPPLHILMIVLLTNTFKCPYLLYTKNEHFLCGTTTAIMKLLQFNITNSIAINPLGIIFS